MKKIIFTSILATTILMGCVSKKKYQAQLTKYDKLSDSCNMIVHRLDACLDEKSRQGSEIKRLEEEIARLRKDANALLNQLSDLSVITSTQAESIKKSLENINSKESYIRNLQNAMARKDSLNLALVLNLKGALKDVNDKDIEINVEGSAVFISISDKLLFSSGRYEITPRAMEVLGKVATVLKAQPEVKFMVEGHTDNKPISTTNIADNWDLSVLRATAVVRVLQQKHGLDPTRMIAAGRGEYIPVTSNSTDAGRSLNRRTRIVIIPQLDQFFKLVESK